MQYIVAKLGKAAEWTVLRQVAGSGYVPFATLDSKVNADITALTLNRAWSAATEEFDDL